MKLYKFSAIFNTLSDSVKKHAPGVLTGLGIGGSIMAMVLTIRSTMQAGEALKEEKDRRERKYFNEIILPKSKEDSNVEGSGVYPLDVEYPDLIEPIEVIRISWRYYIPALVTEGAALACIFASNHISAKRGAALAAAYTLSEEVFKDYRNQVTETIGEKKEKGIRDSIAQKKIDENPAPDKEQMVIIGDSNTLYQDSISGRYFYSNGHDIDNAVASLNFRLVNEMFVSVNDFYDELDNPELPHIEVGDLLGWNVKDGAIRIYFSAAKTADGRPCLRLDYNIGPKYDYMDRY